MVYLAGAALQAVNLAATGGDGAASVAVGLLLLGLPVAVGCRLRRRVPASQAGAASPGVGAAPSAVFALERWAERPTAHPWPAAQVPYQVQADAWVARQPPSSMSPAPLTAGGRIRWSAVVTTTPPGRRTG